MAKGRGYSNYQATVHHHHHRHPRRQLVHSKATSSSSSSMHNDPRNRLVWVPAIPSWEKEFCYKIGSFKWEKFVEAKKHSKWMAPGVMEWDDSAGKEAFLDAKKRFYSQINGLSQPNAFSNLDPDLYVDEINSDEEVNHELYHELELAKSNSSTELSSGEEGDCYDYVPDYYHIAIEDIEPTGWDVDPEEEISKHNVLTGLIVRY